MNCLNKLFYLFYNTETSRIKGSNIKQIRFELFYYLDYIALAYWITAGSKKNKGITLCTDCFTIQEIVMLINMLIIKFEISPTIHKENSSYRIYINKKHLNKILPYIKPYFIHSFLYKIS